MHQNMQEHPSFIYSEEEGEEGFFSGANDVMKVRPELMHRSTSTTCSTMNEWQEMPLLPYLDSGVRSLASITSVKATSVYLPPDRRHWSQFNLVLGSDVDHDPVVYIHGLSTISSLN